MTRRQRQSKRVTAKVIGAGTIPGARGLQIAPLAYVVSGDRTGKYCGARVRMIDFAIVRPGRRARRIAGERARQMSSVQGVPWNLMCKRCSQVRYHQPHPTARSQVETLSGSVARRQPFSNHDPKHKHPNSLSALGHDGRSQASRRPRQPGRLPVQFTCRASNSSARVSSVVRTLSPTHRTALPLTGPAISSRILHPCIDSLALP